MRVYHSAFGLKEEYVGYLGGLKPRILRSFHGNKSTIQPDWCGGLFLDSGAFSAFQSGAVIDIHKYAKFLHENGHVFEVYANLDVIGDVKASMENQRILDQEGLKAIPTFHSNEHPDILRHYADNYDYIAFGGMVPYSGTSGLRNWLINSWEILADYPKIKVHGFGLTDFLLARQFPWYSIDSTTASRAGRTGVLITPWGQLRISRGITSKTGATIHTPYQISKVMEWLGRDMPDLKFDWEFLSNPSTESTHVRTIINARYIEKAVRIAYDDSKKPKNKALL